MRTTKKLALLTAPALAALTLATPASAAHEGSAYEGQLWPLNDSGASGSVELTVSDDGETLAVDLDASGFNLDGPHAIHIHGILEGDEVVASACPTAAEDADGDGVVDVVEGVPRYGTVQISLTTEGDTSPDSALAVERFPSGTTVDYQRDGIPIPEALKPALGKLHVVVHGLDENGNGTLDLDQETRSSLTPDLPREGTAPALCGTLAIKATGPVQTGAGGLAESDTEASAGSTAPAAAATAIGLAGLAVTARRLRRLRTARVSS